MSKEATVYVLDVSPSMQKVTNEQRNIDKAHQILGKMIHVKVRASRCSGVDIGWKKDRFDIFGAFGNPRHAALSLDYTHY